MKKIPVIVIVGATASGKTALAVEIAKRFDGEIISADSMQIYKGMDIATAKTTEEEKQNIPHHLIDFLPVTDTYSVASFVQDAKKIISEVTERGKLPIIAGGTGLYIDALIDNITFEDEPDNTEIRKELFRRKDEEGIEVLYEELCRIDPESAENIHINNEKRVLRALEVYLLTGETLSARQKRSKENPSEYEPLFIQPDYSDREILYNRIDRRVDMMVEAGLIEEAKSYYNIKNAVTASQAIGYKELKGYFEGDISLDEALDNLKKATRHYAKRQLTWFRKNKRINIVLCDTFNSFDELIDHVCDIVKNSEIMKGAESDNEDQY